MAKKKGKGKGKKEAKPKEPFVPPWKLGKPLWYTQGRVAQEVGGDATNKSKIGFWRAAGLDEAKLEDVGRGALPPLPGRSRPSSREPGHER